jgi:microcystin-dependent protein
MGINSAYQWGAVGGEDFHTLNVNEVPPHSHQLMGTTTGASSRAPSGQLFATTSGNATFYTAAASLSALNAATVTTIGGQAHENRQPYLVMNWCIALVGIYPSRN